MGPEYSSLLFIFNFCLLLAVLGLHRFMWAVSSCSKHGRYPVLCCVALLLQSRDSRYAGTGVVAVGPGASFSGRGCRPWSGLGSRGCRPWSGLGSRGRRPWSGLLVVAVGPGAGSGVGAHGLRDSMACGVFLDQGSSPCLLYCQMDS